MSQGRKLTDRKKAQIVQLLRSGLLSIHAIGRATYSSDSTVRGIAKSLQRNFAAELLDAVFPGGELPDVEDHVLADSIVTAMAVKSPEAASPRRCPSCGTLSWPQLLESTSHKLSEAIAERRGARIH